MPKVNRSSMKPGKRGRPKKVVVSTSGDGASVDKQFDEVQDIQQGKESENVNEALQEEEANDIEEAEEANDAEEQIGSAQDPFTERFKAFHGLKEPAMFFTDFQPPNAPTYTDGTPIKFSRLYMHKKTIVDSVGDNMPEAEIYGRKSHAEGLGYRYTWTRKGEKWKDAMNKDGLTPEQIFKDRMKKLDKPAAWPYRTLKFQTEPTFA